MGISWRLKKSLGKLKCRLLGPSDSEAMGWGLRLLVGAVLFFTDGCSAVSCDFGVFVRGGELKVLLLRHLASDHENLQLKMTLMVLM